MFAALLKIQMLEILKRTGIQQKSQLDKVMAIRPGGIWMSGPNVMGIHLIVGEPLHSKPEMSAPWWPCRKCWKIMRLIRIYHYGDWECQCRIYSQALPFVCTKFHTNQSNYWWGISVWSTVAEWAALLMPETARLAVQMRHSTEQLWINVGRTPDMFMHRPSL